jgi:hypothetical protein
VEARVALLQDGAVDLRHIFDAFPCVSFGGRPYLTNAIKSRLPMNLKPALPFATPLSCFRHCAEMSDAHWCTSAAWYEWSASTVSGTCA